MTNTKCTPYVEQEFDQRFVVGEVEVHRLDSLDRVRLELAAEDVAVEEHLQLFIGRVDAKLLEAVVLEILEAVDVQNCDRQHPLPAAEPDTDNSFSIRSMENRYPV